MSSFMHVTPVIPCSTSSMSLCHTAWADVTRDLIFFNRNNPQCVLMVSYLRWPSSTFICRYAFIRSSFVNCSPPDSLEKYFVHSRYWSALIHCLKHHRIFELCCPSFLGIMTIWQSGSLIPKLRGLFVTLYTAGLISRCSLSLYWYIISQQVSEF